MEEWEVTYGELANILLSNDRKIDDCLRILRERGPPFAEPALDQIRIFIEKTFLKALCSYWAKAHRNRARFLVKYKDWLNKKFPPAIASESSEAGDVDAGIGSEIDTEPSLEVVELQTAESSGTKRGRPRKRFQDCCSRNQRRQIKRLRATTSPELLRRAAEPNKLSPEEGLDQLMVMGLSKDKYTYLRLSSKKRGLDVYPAYNHVLTAKKLCYPKNMQVTESSFTVSAEDLLQHTVERLLLALPDALFNSLSSQLTLVAKWGCDGSSGHSEYKQKFADDSLSDGSLFLTCMVPLRLQSTSDASNIYWENPTPSSTRMCRPLRFELVQETAIVIRREVARVRAEIAGLERHAVIVREKSFVIDFSMILSMIDGKIVQILNDTPSMATCSLCGAKPSEMNNVDALLARVPDASLLMAMSPLHARIKFMECILNVAYNMSFKTWSVVGDESKKAAKKAEKERIKREFILELGLKVHVVKQGFGCTNDGNTSRRFFANAALSAQITRIDQELIENFGTILNTINCTQPIDVEKFEAFCLKTANRFVELYEWYYMPNSVHKILIHGGQIIRGAPVPIGMLSEEAQEAQNKVFRLMRTHHSHKMSRETVNGDVGHMMLARSDAYMSLAHHTPAESTVAMDPTVPQLLEDSRQPESGTE